MATKQFYFTGRIEWAKRQLDDRYNNWTVNLYPDDATEKLIRETGCQSKPKLNRETKEVFYTFRRPAEKLMRGEMVKFEAPKFFIVKDGKAEEFDGIVGNGSMGQVKVSIYDIPSQGTKGTRYEAVMITDLVEYTPPAPLGADEAVGQVPGAVAAKVSVTKSAHSPSVPF